MRVVLDTNVLVSALLGTGSPPARLLTLWARRRYQLLTADLQLEELRRVTRYPKIRKRLRPAQAGALANVARHAQARRLVVRLGASESEVRLEVADDGRGFDPATASNEQRFGLYGMQERARSIACELTVESAAGKGTAVRLVVRRKDDTRPDM